MDANTEKQPCQCELCQPNWHMGHDGDSFVPQPVAEVRQVLLEESYARRRAAMTELSPATV